jgi:hypothetical protein
MDWNAIEGAVILAMVIGMLLYRWKLKNPGRKFIVTRDLTAEEREKAKSRSMGFRMDILIPSQITRHMLCCQHGKT